MFVCFSLPLKASEASDVNVLLKFCKLDAAGLMLCCFIPAASFVMFVRSDFIVFIIFDV